MLLNASEPGACGAMPWRPWSACSCSRRWSFNVSEYWHWWRQQGGVWIALLFPYNEYGTQDSHDNYRLPYYFPNHQPTPISPWIMGVWSCPRCKSCSYATGEDVCAIIWETSSIQGAAASRKAQQKAEIMVKERRGEEMRGEARARSTLQSTERCFVFCRMIGY